jgi:cell wall-associated NlpC family hydrolase
MKRTLRLLIVMAAAFAVVSPVRAIEEEDETFSKKLKDFFVRTPTPAPSRKKKKSTAVKKKEPSPSPSAAPKPKTGETPKPSSTPKPKASETPKASATPKPKASVTPKASATPKPSPTPATPRSSSTAVPLETPTPTPIRTPKETPTPSPSATAKKKEPNATITTDEIVGYENYSPEVRKIVESALSLTTQNLGYKYGSADPANGGMDCSGFIHYVLSKEGISDVPRDAREQYIWVRKAGTFQAVLGHSDDTFELDDLKPGDLLFWSGTYVVDRDPDITHTMIYLGREKANNRRVMVGASDGRTYKGQSRFGVSVFDFKVARLGAKTDDKPGPAFVGYGRVPGLPKD